MSAGSHYAHLEVSWESFFLAVLAGAVITLLTRMQHATEDLGVKIVPAIVLSFVLVGESLRRRCGVCPVAEQEASPRRPPRGSRR